MNRKLTKTIILALIALCLTATLAGCGSRRVNYIKDFYGEYKLKLPFAHSNMRASGVVSFESELTLTEMCEELKTAGFAAEIYEDEASGKKIFVVASKGSFRYYFLVYDKSRWSADGTRFTVEKCDTRYNPNAFDQNSYGNGYSLLFPNHLAEYDYASGTSKITSYQFSDFASFYENTGKGDATIDYENKTVTFSCKVNNRQLLQGGDVIIRYVASDEGNYIILTHA